MKPLVQMVLLAAALALPAMAHGASSVQATRSAATSARQHVNEVRANQMRLRAQLNQVAARIETLKGSAKGRLAAGAELDGALKQSQELSGSLTELAQSLSAAEADATREHLALLSALSSELSRLRQDFDRVIDRAARKQLILQMRALRAEREQVRAALPAAVVPALEAPRSSDDPEDLLEQADAARDSEDKVRRELQALEARIAESREERAFARRLDEFLGDESIFDDQDRRLRLERNTTETTTSGPRDDLAPPAAAKTETPAGAQGAAPMSGGADPTNGNNFGPSGSESGASGSRGTEIDTSVISRSTRASDARPTVGGGPGPGIFGSEDEDLEDLEVQRARLKGLAEELSVRAAQLQQRARALQ